MTDPKRLAQASDNEVERRLLQAGRISAPPSSKERALLVASGALGVSGAAASGAAASKGTALGMAKAGSIASLKWIGVVGLTGIGTVAGAVVVHEVRESRTPIPVEIAPASTSRSPTAGAGRSRQQRAPETGGWTPTSIDPITLAPASTEVVLSPPAPILAPAFADAGSSTSSTLPAEMATLEEARGALAAGDPSRCLWVLEHYEERFPRGSMAPEAAMVRIEALAKSGDRAAATRAADALLAGDPDSPYAARVRSLLGTSNQ